jgi:hypothetical protein
MAGPTSTALYLMTKRYGFMKATKLLNFMASWAVAMKANDWQPITVEQYAAHFGMSRAKAFKEQQLWRDLIPNEPTPTARVLAARAEYAKAMRSDPSPQVIAAYMAGMPAA